jgi:hypothetical protein
MAYQMRLLTKGVALAVTALLCMTPGAWAGEHVRAGDASAGRHVAAATSPAPAVQRARYYAPAPVVMSVQLQPPARAGVAPVYVTLRGPDGQARRFPVEGGTTAIRTRDVVLHPGESVSVVWTAGK